MSQESLFNNFSPMYHPDMQLQFAPSVPQRQSRQVPMNLFQQEPFQNQQFLPGFPGPNAMASPPSSTATTPKQLQTKAERRAEHNAIERARRESLNVKFQQLAFALPNLQNDTRPSKSTIIDRTLDFVKTSIQKEERYQRRIKELEKFNSYLLSESDKRLQHKKLKKNRSINRRLSASSSPTMVPDMMPGVSERKRPSSFGIDKEEDVDDEEEEEEDDEDDEEEEEQDNSVESTDTKQQLAQQKQPMPQQFMSNTMVNGVQSPFVVSPSSAAMIPTAKQEFWPTQQQQQQQSFENLIQGNKNGSNPTFFQLQHMTHHKSMPENVLFSEQNSIFYPQQNSFMMEGEQSNHHFMHRR
ncbi:uncharacterized protein B0P05DRAFT_528808 [Gilbertella persicaria]|uniref:uncharacterized protein n=1 Tax=Gilbertella persicaria TaxID=101096 RepID=UPI00221F38B7|nr:uncharacterized protein B0P05DRAFT_528808 [Gilbertella persicaria]KAI8091103.1 hypothetical protein B0P05DRAFT_528808 [Gilbertella persicaria]